MRHTPLLKKYLLITESSQKRFASINAEIRNKQVHLYDITGPHWSIEICNQYTVTVRNNLSPFQETSERHK